MRRGRDCCSTILNHTLALLAVAQSPEVTHAESVGVQYRHMHITQVRLNAD
jgi:hypothetical protein